MANERKTEALVKKRLDRLGYYKDTSIIVVEEQQSDNPRIAKLLKNASKKGGGRGYPEFILSSRECSDFLIVIECKADPAKHVSSTLDQYADYAVDGALLYASFLSKEFDVLAIAVSGETERELRISHNIHLRGAVRGGDFKADELLSFDNYRASVMQSDDKRRQDTDTLTAYSHSLNERLHAKKIREAQRSMLICGILVALDNRAFAQSYKSHKTAKQIADALMAAVVTQFESANLEADRIRNLRQAFSFIGTDATLTNDKEFVLELIGDIDENVNKFVRTHKYYDAVGQFYIQFLRYANNDKHLGIVLTPPHIAELFVGLAEVNKNSVVFDSGHAGDVARCWGQFGEGCCDQ